MKKKLLLASVLTGMMILATGCGIEMPEMPDASASSDEITFEEQRQAVYDKVIRAQDDFYGYINKDELLKMKIEYGESSAGNFANLAKSIDKSLMDKFENISSGTAEYDEGTSEYIIKKAYKQFNDFQADTEAKENAKKVIRSEIARINELSSIDELVSEMEYVNDEYGINCIIGLTVDGNYHDADEYAVVAMQMPTVCGTSAIGMKENQAAAQNVEDAIVKTYRIAGLDTKEGKKTGKELAYIALDIAWSTDRDILESVSPYSTFKTVSVGDIDKQLTNLDAATIQKISGINNNPYGAWEVQDINQIVAIDSKFTDENLGALKAWMLMDFVNSFSDYLAEDFDFMKSYEDLNEKDKIEKRYQNISNNFTEAVSDIYTKDAFTEEMSDELDKICEDVRAGYRVKISEAEWLSEASRKKLLEKLENIKFISGKNAYTEDEIKGTCLFGDNWFETEIMVAKHAKAKSISNLGTKKDRMKAGMPMNMTNACYNPDNTVTITVAIMGGEFYEYGRDYYSNLGGLGAVVAHEVGHGFDSNCITWDMNGDYNPDWLSEEDMQSLEARNEVAASYFEKYFSVFDVYHVDGNKTLGENYADLGGVECIMTRCSTKEQREKVFKSYASIWRELTIENNVINQIDVDEHSPATIRVNAILASIKEFNEDYELKEGDGMYIAPENRITRW